MCGKIDCFVTAFANLRTDENQERWSAATNFRDPHKPVLLLSIVDLVAQGTITKEFIELTPELEETFNNYWQRILPDSNGSMAEPFYQMEKEPFWTLVPRSGVEQPGKEMEFTREGMRRFYLGARLDNELIPLLLMDPLRRRLKEALVQTYFAPKVQGKLREES